MTAQTLRSRTGTDIGPCRDRFDADRSLSTGTDRDRFSSFDSSCTYAKGDLEAIGPYPSLHQGQGPIGTDFRVMTPYTRACAMDPKPEGTEIGPSGPCPSLWITR